MKYKHAIILGIGFLAGFQAQAKAAAVSLGTASSFAVLGDSTVTNTGLSIITGDVGVSSGSVVIGFPPGIVVPPGTIYTANAVAFQAQSDSQVAYNYLAGLAPTQDLTGQDLGGQMLTPGVYSFLSSAQLTGTLTLNNLGDPNALFVFQIGSTLTTASNSSILTTNSGDYPNLFFQVGSSATLGTDTQFRGNILANTSITLNNGANIECGRALAQNGAVTLDTNSVSTSCVQANVASVPEPFTIVGTLIGGTAAFRMRKKLKASGF